MIRLIADNEEGDVVRFHSAVCALLALAVILPSLLQPDTGRADVSLPIALTEITEEAFAGDTSLTALTLPQSLTAVGARAFDGCTALNLVSVPDNVTQIGEAAFSGCGEALLIRCTSGSAAHTYALENKIDYQADTTYRALVIGQTYPETQMALNGPANDLRSVRSCLQNMGYDVTAQSNLTADGILSAVTSVFSTATGEDVSLFYYSGHGETDGSLMGSTGKDFVSPAQLKTVLDQIPGRKVVLVDACYSGQLIAENDSSRLLTGASTRSDGAAQFLSAFQSTFSRERLLRGTLNADAYFVITAAREDEESEEGLITSDGSKRTMGFFSYAFCLGLGYNGITYRVAALSADANEDGAVSIQEAYEYARSLALTLNDKQHASVWPFDCRWFAPFRP